jgi:integrase/recombinase XerD
MNSALSWLELVESYLAYRRSLGFDLRTQEFRLRDFATFAGKRVLLTVDLAAAWARNSKVQSPIAWAGRIETLRGFAKYLKRYDSAHEVPPSNIFGSNHHRQTPHIFTAEELLALLNGTHQFLPAGSLRAATCRTVFGLLASTGLRISEALKLRRKDFSFESRLLHIREAKFHKERYVPIHSSVAHVLLEYANLRDRIVVNPETDHFFLFDNGKQAKQRGINYALRVICRRLKWRTRGTHRNHRLHDLRHNHEFRIITSKVRWIAKAQSRKDRA